MKLKMFESANELTRVVAEFRTIIPGQDTRWFQVNSQPQKAENGDVGLDGVILEITDRKEAELANDVLAKVTKTKDEFWPTCVTSFDRLDAMFDPFVQVDSSLTRSEPSRPEWICSWSNLRK